MTESALPDTQGASTTDPLDARRETVARAVAQWTRHLVDLGGRNNLLWYRDLRTGTLDLSNAHPSGIALLMTGRPTKLSDIVREAGAFEEARRRVRAIAAKSRELSEERGVETCFVAFGLATWDLGGTGRPPAAPVLLRGATLRATDAAGSDHVLDLTPHVEFNPVLEHYLRGERGIDVDADALEALSTAGSGFDPYPVYADLSERCLSIPGFSVTARVVLANFSYTKLPMVADLAAQGDSLATHDVVAAIAGDRSALGAVRVDVPRRTRDPVLDDAAATLVLDADSSQQAAIEAARSGAHLVIQGPPGTGKSQTIANLMAALAADGKRVLFVAQKRAAIDAVIGRLDRVGLSDLVLDLYDGARARRRVTADLARALEEAPQGSDLDALVRASATRIPESRRVQVESATALDEHLHAMHDSRPPWQVSAHEVMTAVSALSRRPHPPRSRVRLRGEVLSGLGADDRDAAALELARLAAVGAWRDDGAADPWFGASLPTTDDAVAARDRVERLAGGGIDALHDTLAEVLVGLRLPRDQSLTAWGATLATLASVRDTLEVFRAEIFDTPLDDAVAASAPRSARRSGALRHGWWERRRILKAARGLLRPGPPPADLHAALSRARGQRNEWRDLAGGGGRPEIPADLDRARREHARVLSDVIWLQERLPAEPGRVPLVDLDRSELTEVLAHLAATPDRLAVVPTVRAPLDDLTEQGWGELIADLAARRVPADRVADEVHHVWWSSLAEELALHDPAIGGHAGEHLRSRLDRFVEADRAVIDAGAQEVHRIVIDRVQRLLAAHPEQAATLRAEGARRRGGRTLRELLPLTADLATRVRPCWVMSPLVVASVLPPGRWFDTVIFDEASQVPPAEAISAISRADQVVVAGDGDQLPPTTFFTTVVDDETPTGPPGESGPLTEGLESILDVLTAVLPVRRLRWHYRSLDERLIAFANHEVYDGSLITFPGARREDVLTLEVVDGQGLVDEHSATVESTRAEVRQVVRLVLEHARERPQESLGVITLGLPHALRIEEELRAALAEAYDGTALTPFFAEDRPERFFVKNLERVQGDERDAVILSIGYGKTPHGRVLHRFGPLNQEGGERRLNVAITRARRRMTVVSALRAEDLDPVRLKARGAMMLRDFLAYAATGGVRESAPVATDRSDRDALLADLGDRLAEQGLVVHRGVGTSANRIPLVVEARHPGIPAVAVESDGRAYAAIPGVRDRDRLRSEQLRRVGWQTVRVWERDIYRDPAREVERVRAAASRAHDREDSRG